MEASTLIDALREQGELLARAARATPLDTPVPTCPDWTVGDLVRHTGRVHRWAATIVAEARTEPIRMSEQSNGEQPGDGEVLDWFSDGHASLVAALSAAPADLDCWAFLRNAASPLDFWARRQAHETVIHRVDAESAAGRRTSIDVDLAADGIDELLTGFLPRFRDFGADPGRTLLVHATDVDRKWLVRLGSDRPKAEPAEAGATADATVGGPAEAVYLTLWNRCPMAELAITGDPELPKRWAETVRV